MSHALNSFRENSADVEALIDLHAEKGGHDPGRRRGLEVLNKSAVVLVCAFWEAYCEDIAAEGLEHLVTHGAGPGQLPPELRKQIAKELRALPNDLEVWRLAEDGWRQVLLARLEDFRIRRNRQLNTPKTDNINELFLSTLGIEKISNHWRWKNCPPEVAARKLDNYVTRRGDIAHRGKSGISVRKAAATNFFSHVSRLVEATERAVLDVVNRSSIQPMQ